MKRQLSLQPSLRPHRRGVIAVLAAILMVLIFAFVAFSLDVGYMALIKSELQNSADASALAASAEMNISQAKATTVGKQVATLNFAGSQPIADDDVTVEFGNFDFATKSFTVDPSDPNAVRVTTERNDHPTFFGPIIGHSNFSSRATAISMINPRDIVFVVDLSGSMNDDTEPCWATSTIDKEFTSKSIPNPGTDLLQDVYDDLGFGAFPGNSEYIGEPLGIAQNKYAYAELTKDDGPLAQLSNAYKIDKNDTEAVRKKKAYLWMMQNQIAQVMPAARPAPTIANYDYWEAYLDYIIERTSVGSNPPKPKPNPKPKPSPKPNPKPNPKPKPKPKPPIGFYLDEELLTEDDYALVEEPRVLAQWAGLGERGLAELLVSATVSASEPGIPRRGSTKKVWLPHSQDGDRIDDFNNPNKFTFPSASSNLPRAFRNQIGYRTYVQFMMDWGRDRSPQFSNNDNADPAKANKTQLSKLSPYCVYHNEATAGGTFSFPAREQPMHAVRRSLIAALQVVKEMNETVKPGYGDMVSIVTYDALDKYHEPELLVSLTADYDAAMQACTTMQAVSDIGTTTATEAGLVLARNHLLSAKEGGEGRPFANKVVILLTDGIPNVWSSDEADIADYMDDNPSSEYYDPNYPWYNSVLMQTSQFQADDDGKLFGVGMGMGADYDFMDRIARTALTDEGGQSPRTSGDPTEYEQKLTEIFREIITRSGSRLVK